MNDRKIMNLSDPFQESFAYLIQLQQEVARLHPALAELYPVAVCVDDRFQIYDLLKGEISYQLIKTAPIPMPVPAGVRAAFPLEAYEGRIAAVVTPDVFDSLDGIVTIFHEFVHCYQFSTCEGELKMSLDIARLAEETGDVMWEIEYPFPYTARTFIRGYQQFIRALVEMDERGIVQARRGLFGYLGVHDFEYMVWQEWKEGFARWIENRLQRELGLTENTKGASPPYSRVSFYAGGAATIDFLSTKAPNIVNDLPGLFSRMADKSFII